MCFETPKSVPNLLFVMLLHRWKIFIPWIAAADRDRVSVTASSLRGEEARRLGPRALQERQGWNTYQESLPAWATLIYNPGSRGRLKQNTASGAAVSSFPSPHSESSTPLRPINVFASRTSRPETGCVNY